MGWRSWLVACVSDGDIGDVLMAGIAFHFDVRTVRILDELWKCFFSHSGSIEMCELYWVESKKDRAGVYTIELYFIHGLSWIVRQWDL